MPAAARSGKRTPVSSLDLFAIDAERNRVAVLYYEPRRPRGVSLIAGHGYSSSKHNLDFLCGFLASHGFGVYSIDFPGHKLGASGGTLRGVDDCVDAMSAAVRFARERGDAAAYTMGHSMGGMTAIFTAALDARILGTVAITTGYGRPTSLAALQKAGATDFRSAYVDGVSLPELVEGIDARYEALLPRLLGRSSLYVAAQRDAMVNPRSVRELYDRAPERKTFETIDSDHTFAGERARSVVLQWLNELHPRA
jgi:pimeloyl-ACP methyl ester carboxylesterase